MLAVRGSDSSRELRTASERLVAFGSGRGTDAYRTQGANCPIRRHPHLVSFGTHFYSCETLS